MILPGGHFEGSVFVGARFDDADLSGSDFSGANFTGARLAGADLRHSNLRQARLVDADLSGANLAGADLTGARLLDAILSGADLRGALVDGADLLSAVNLSGALGVADSVQVATNGKRELTVSDLALLRGIVEGLGTGEIAEKLGWGQQTVRNKMVVLARKLGVSGRLELARYAIGHGLVDLAALSRGTRGDPGSP